APFGGAYGAQLWSEMQGITTAPEDERSLDMQQLIRRLEKLEHELELLHQERARDKRQPAE
ncbi:MAG: hypothetical protein KAW95_00485, partial [Dehalococcoidia bacterium]|nr:hypothetical protein [Dehalococcoidia bacterium]